MRDVFPDEAVEGRTALEFATNDAEASRIRDGLEAQQVCPFCGAVGDGSATHCPKCAMENNAAARKATKLRIGPWYVLQNRNPAAPGMKWETLLSFVRKGRVKPQSVVRGPTTHQLWRFAAHVKGLSREFGVCYSCGGSMERGGNLCPHCNRLQEPPINPDTLLEGGEPEARGPIFREIPAQEAGQSAAAVPAELDAEIKEKLRQAEDVLRERREQGDAVDRIRQELEREKESAARDREAAARERENAVREREAVNRDKEALERERLALARDRETARRERELRGQSERVVETERQPTANKAPSAPTAVWDMSEPDTDTASDLYAEMTKKAVPVAEKPAPAVAGAKGRTAREGFLSAKDLAAAFKLNHQMAIAARERKSLREDDSSDDESPARFKPIGRRGARRNGGKIFLILVVLVWVVGAAVVLAYHPAWRAQIVAWYSRVSHGSSTPTVPTPAGPALPEKTDEPPTPPEGLAPSTQPSETQPVRPPDTEPATIVAPPAPIPVPTTAPSAVVPPVEPPAPHVVDPPPPAPAPGPVAPPVVVRPETPPPTSAPTPEIPPAPVDVKSQAKLLYRKAKEAEFRNDLPEAIRYYQMIVDTIPSTAWPSSDIELRLQLAKKQLGQ